MMSASMPWEMSFPEGVSCNKACMPFGVVLVDTEYSAYGGKYDLLEVVAGEPGVSTGRAESKFRRAIFLPGEGRVITKGSADIHRHTRESLEASGAQPFDRDVLASIVPIDDDMVVAVAWAAAADKAAITSPLGAPVRCTVVDLKGAIETLTASDPIPGGYSLRNVYEHLEGKAYGYTGEDSEQHVCSDDVAMLDAVFLHYMRHMIGQRENMYGRAPSDFATPYDEAIMDLVRGFSV